MRFQLNIFLVLFVFSSYAQDPRLIYPVASKGEVKDNYHGTIVEDPYRWLENDTLATTRNWVKEENELTEKYMNKLLFKYPVEEQLNYNARVNFGTLYRSGNYYFEFIRRRGEATASLYIKKKIGEVAMPDLAVDPEEFRKSKKDRVEISDFEVSGDNKFLAFSLSGNGSDWMEIRVKSIKPLRNCPDVITGVKFSNIEWKGNGFFYCRYQSLLKDKPLTSLLVNPCIYYHKLGTSQDEDSLIFQYPGSKVVGTLSFKVLEDERFLMVYHGSSIAGKHMNYISYLDYSSPEPLWKVLLAHPEEKDNFFSVVGFLNGQFIVHTDIGAPHRRVIALNPSKPNKATELIPEDSSVLKSVNLIDRKLVAIYLKDVDQYCITYDSTGKFLKSIIYPVGSSVNGFAGTNRDSTTIFYFHSFLHPPIAYEYNLRTLKMTLIQKTEITYNLESLDIQKVFYHSKDGTRIPMLIAGKKGLKKDGKVPAILYGYGGYGISYTPFFDIGFITHIRNGGIVALPCIRGGGEYGEEWHEKGKMENKQNVFDDFIAAAEYLVANKYTSQEKLALMGGSNGGLLVAAVLTQRPDLFKVAVCNVGVYDMLRYHRFTVGFNWVEEYGCSRDSVQFQYLYKYSPLHAVKNVEYPAVLIITADHDDRVVPMHSYKFAATLQEKTTGTAPVLLYTQSNAGHGGDGSVGKSKAYIYAFIYKNLGVKASSLSFYD